MACIKQSTCSKNCRKGQVIIMHELFVAQITDFGSLVLDGNLDQTFPAGAIVRKKKDDPLSNQTIDTKNSNYQSGILLECHFHESGKKKQVAKLKGFQVSWSFHWCQWCTNVTKKGREWFKDGLHAFGGTKESPFQHKPLRDISQADLVSVWSRKEVKLETPRASLGPSMSTKKRVWKKVCLSIIAEVIPKTFFMKYDWQLFPVQESCRSAPKLLTCSASFLFGRRRGRSSTLFFTA